MDLPPPKMDEVGLDPICNYKGYTKAGLFPLTLMISPSLDTPVVLLAPLCPLPLSTSTIDNILLVTGVTSYTIGWGGINNNKEKYKN